MAEVLSINAGVSGVSGVIGVEGVTGNDELLDDPTLPICERFRPLRP